MTEGFQYEAAAVVEASVEHHAPCVPECRVCYPPATEPTEESEG